MGHVWRASTYNKLVLYNQHMDDVLSQVSRRVSEVSARVGKKLSRGLSKIALKGENALLNVEEQIDRLGDEFGQTKAGQLLQGAANAAADVKAPTAYAAYSVADDVKQGNYVDAAITAAEYALPVPNRTGYAVRKAKEQVQKTFSRLLNKGDKKQDGFLEGNYGFKEALGATFGGKQIQHITRVCVDPKKREGLDYAVNALQRGLPMANAHLALCRRFDYMPFVYIGPLDFQRQLNRAFLLCWMDIKRNCSARPFMFSNTQRTIALQVMRDFSVHVMIVGHLSLGTVPDLLDRIRQAGCTVTQAEVRLQRCIREEGLGLEAGLLKIALDPTIETCGWNVACDEARVLVLKPPQSEMVTDPVSMLAFMLRAVCPPENPGLGQDAVPVSWSAPPEELQIALSAPLIDADNVFNMVARWSTQPPNRPDSRNFTLEAEHYITNGERGNQFHVNPFQAPKTASRVKPPARKAALQAGINAKRPMQQQDNYDSDEDSDFAPSDGSSSDSGSDSSETESDSSNTTAEEEQDPEQTGDDALPLPEEDDEEPPSQKPGRGKKRAPAGASKKSSRAPARKVKKDNGDRRNGGKRDDDDDGNTDSERSDADSYDSDKDSDFSTGSESSSETTPTESDTESDSSSEPNSVVVKPKTTAKPGDGKAQSKAKRETTKTTLQPLVQSTSRRKVNSDKPKPLAVPEPEVEVDEQIANEEPINWRPSRRRVLDDESQASVASGASQKRFDRPAFESRADQDDEDDEQPVRRRITRPFMDKDEIHGVLTRIGDAMKYDHKSHNTRQANFGVDGDSIMGRMTSLGKRPPSTASVRYDPRWAAVLATAMGSALWRAQEKVAAAWPMLVYKGWFDQAGRSKCFFTEHGAVTRAFNESQEFLRRWFSPALKQFGVHGVLVNTSTGSGKTCAAVAAATTSFVRATRDGPGFDVVWWISRSGSGGAVRNTRNKELLQKTCSVITRAWIEQGHKLPPNMLDDRYNPTEEGRAFLKSEGKYGHASGWGWMPDTASFKQFYHYIAGDQLWSEKVHSVAKQWGKKFPNNDRLYRTLIIMDEAHNAVLNRSDSQYDISIEEFYKIQSAIHNSQRLSGINGCMTMLLTATPAKGGALNGFRLLNCLRAQNDFPNTPEQMTALTAQNADGLLSERQLRKFAELAKGMIVYTDAAYDPGRMPVVRVHHKFQIGATSEQRSAMKRCASLADRAKCLRQYANSVFGREGQANVSTVDGVVNRPRIAKLQQYWNSGQALVPKELNPFYRYHQELQAKAPMADVMLQMIMRLDKQDMKLYGKKFKHFIVCAESGPYGAKFLSWVFLVGGYRMAEVAVNGQMKYGNLMPPNPVGSNAFVCVTGTAMFNCESKPNYFLRYPGGHDDACHKADGPKRELPDNLTGLFNAPYNANGEYVRFCIFDKQLMEGMDVYDTPYVHLYGEMSASDKRQAVGRVTRQCGSSCLPRLFTPYEGWPVTVCEYYIDHATNGLSISVQTAINADRTARLVDQFDSFCAYAAIDRVLNPQTNPYGREKDSSRPIGRHLPLFPMAGKAMLHTTESAAQALTNPAAAASAPGKAVSALGTSVARHAPMQSTMPPVPAPVRATVTPASVGAAVTPASVGAAVTPASVGAAVTPALVPKPEKPSVQLPMEPGLSMDSPLGLMAQLINREMIGQLHAIQNLPQAQRATAAYNLLNQLQRGSQASPAPLETAQQEIKEAPGIMQRIANYWRGGKK
jgi:hypothetical protein